MIRKLRFIVGFLLFITVAFFIFPNHGFALDFTIPDVKIDAYLQENGDAKVKESFTYNFEDDFNGISRSLLPKKGSEITDVRAEENGKTLKVEEDEETFLIHRKGSEETVEIDILYTIENAADVYTDVGEFYWPFFDDSNETDYENFTVAVHPPQETDEVIAFGYDEAFKKEAIQSDGIVLFEFGEVPSGKKGDIRVAYDAALFPDSEKSNKTMKDDILAAQQELLDEAEAWTERRDILQSIGTILIPALTLIFLFIITQAIIRVKARKENIRRGTPSGFFVPKETMSLPAIIQFTNSGQLHGETLAAAFLDLIRQGFVKRVSDDRFKIIGSPDNLQEHEQHLLQFLFEEVGTNGEFSFDDLTQYTEDKKNHETYYKQQLKWQEGIRKEVKEKRLYEKKMGIRSILGIGSIILFPFLIAFPLHELYILFAGTLILFISMTAFALLYWPKTNEGLAITHEWKLLKDNLKDLPEKVWESLSEDEQMLVYLYALGTKDERFAKNEEMIGSFELPSNANVGSFSGAADMSMIYYIGPMAAATFHTAHDTTGSNASTSSTMGGGGGGGVGGGGGGSGAF